MAVAAACRCGIGTAAAACLASWLLTHPLPQAAAESAAAQPRHRPAIYVEVTDKLDVSPLNLEPTIVVTIKIHNDSAVSYKKVILEYLASDGEHDILDVPKEIPALDANSVLPIEVRIPYKDIEVPKKLIISSIYVSPGDTIRNLFDSKSGSPNEFKLASSTLPKRLKDAREMYADVEGMIGSYPPLAGSETSPVAIEEAHLLLPGDPGNGTKVPLIVGTVRNNSKITCSSVRLSASLYKAPRTMDFPIVRDEAVPVLRKIVEYGLGGRSAGSINDLNLAYSELKSKLGTKWLDSGSADTKDLAPGDRWHFRIPFKVAPAETVRPIISNLGFAQRINPG